MMFGIRQLVRSVVLSAREKREEKMKWWGFDIEEVCRTRDRTVRGKVFFQFEQDWLDQPDDIDRPVSPTIEVTVYVTIDPASTFEEVEKALLDEARRFLKVAMDQSSDATPQEIRAAVDSDQRERERHFEEEHSARMDEVLRGVGVKT